MVSYLSLLQQFFDNQLPVVGYISLPKSKELINLIKYYLKQEDDITSQELLSPAQFNFNPGFSYKTTEDINFETLVDADLMAELLPESSRSAVFEHRSSTADHYPAGLKPHFFYLNTGSEIARVELPAWLASNPEKIDEMCLIIMDQVRKGRGYPVVLAEAHEAAVVKSADREFFYYILSQLTVKYNRRYIISQKSLKKRGMNV